MKHLAFIFALICTGTALIAQSWQSGTGVIWVNPLTTNVGIGINTPIRPLQISRSSYGTETTLRLSSTDNYYAAHRNHWDIVNVPQGASSPNCIEYRFGSNSTSENPTMTTKFRFHFDGTLYASAFYVLNSPAYYIAPANTGTSINVAGKIISKEIEVVELNTNLLKSDAIKTGKLNVKMDNVADYVFNCDYKLRSLNEVEQFVRINKHLPDVPDAAQLSATGMDVASMNNLLLQKIEEITLYMIGLNKENQLLKAEIESLKQAQ